MHIPKIFTNADQDGSFLDSLCYILPVSRQDIVIFFRQLAAMHQAGITLVASIRIIAKGQPEGRFKNIIDEISRDLLMGKSFSSALAKHRDVFSGVNLGMIKAGEEGGTLGSILERVAFNEEKDYNLIRRVKAAITYPMTVFIGAVLLVFLLMNYLFAGLLETILQFGIPLPLPTLICYYFSRVLHNPVSVFILLIIFAGGIIAAKKYLDTPKGRENRGFLVIRLPLIGSIIKKIISARFCRILGTLYECGMPIISAIGVTAEACGNSALVKEIKSRINLVSKEGESIAEGIFSSYFFSSQVRQIVNVGERSGKLGPLLIKIAEFYESEVDFALDTFTTTIEPFMIGFIGIVVGFIMVAVLSPLYKIAAVFSS